MNKEFNDLSYEIAQVLITMANLRKSSAKAFNTVTAIGNSTSEEFITLEIAKELIEFQEDIMNKYFKP